MIFVYDFEFGLYLYLNIVLYFFKVFFLNVEVMLLRGVLISSLKSEKKNI